MSPGVYFQFLLALVFVIALIAGLGWAVRRLGWGARFVAPADKRRLSVVEILPLDGKRRLVLLRRDEIEHLVLLGGDHDVLIESGVSAASRTGAIARSETP